MKTNAIISTAILGLVLVMAIAFGNLATKSTSTKTGLAAEFANQISRVNEAKRAAAETIYGLGRLYESHSELKKAMNCYREAFELYPGYTEARDAYFRLDARLNQH